jgi:putative nucleotidyltransferase with HDIG domain
MIHTDACPIANYLFQFSGIYDIKTTDRQISMGSARSDVHGLRNRDRSNNISGDSTMDDHTTEAEVTIAFTDDMDEVSIEKKRQAVLQFEINSSTATFSLDAPQILIGRGKDVDLRIPDNYLSGKHARILIVHNFFHIEDLGSRNGTWVNGEKVTFMRLAHMDVVRLGQTNLRFLQQDVIDDNYIQKLNLQTIQSLALAVEAKDPYTKGHSERVAEISEHLAIMMGFAEADAERVRIAGILHDIGKIGVPETVLLNKSGLSESEYEVVKQHVVEGKHILMPLDFLSDIIPAVYHHHERYDGTGYPDGLVGEEIPLWARIVQVADTCDAMTIDRPYRKAFSKDQVIDELNRCSGTQFDPDITHPMIEILQN